MGRLWLILGSASGFISVAAGAFGAHALKKRLDPDMLQTFETGARYEMFHALALLGVGLLALQRPSAACELAGWAFVAGTALFSGSLYLLAVTGTRWLGFVTPFGGVAFLLGWAALAWAAFRCSLPNA